MVKTFLTGLATIALMALVFKPIASQSMTTPPTDATGFNTVAYANIGDPIEQFASACNQFIYMDTALFTTTDTASPWSNTNYVIAEIFNKLGNCLFQYATKTEPLLANVINTALNNSVQIVSLMQQDRNPNITAARAIQTAYLGGTNRTRIRNITSFVKSSIQTYSTVASMPNIQQPAIDDFNTFLDGLKEDFIARNATTVDMNQTRLPLWENQMTEFNNTLKVLNSTVMSTVNKIRFDLANANVTINNSFALNIAATNATWAEGYAAFQFPACGPDAFALGVSAQNGINAYYTAIQQAMGQFLQSTSVAINTGKTEFDVWRNNFAQYFRAVSDLKNFTMPVRTNLTALNFANERLVQNATNQTRAVIANLTTPMNPFYIAPTPAGQQQPAAAPGAQAPLTLAQQWTALCDAFKAAFNQVYSQFALASEERFSLIDFANSIDAIQASGSSLINAFGQLHTSFGAVLEQPASPNRDPNNPLPFGYDNLVIFWNNVFPGAYQNPLNDQLNAIQNAINRIRSIPPFPASQFFSNRQFNQTLTNFSTFFVNTTANMTRAFNNTRNLWLQIQQLNMNAWRGFAANQTAVLGQKISDVRNAFQSFTVETQKRWLALNSAVERSSFEPGLLLASKEYQQNYLAYLNGIFPSAAVAYPTLPASGTYRTYLIMLNDTSVIPVNPGQILDPSAAVPIKKYYYVTIDIGRLNRTTTPAIQVSTFQSLNRTSINGTNGATALNLAQNPMFYNSQPQLPASYIVDPNYTPNWTGLANDPFESKSDYVIDLLNLSANYIVFKVTSMSPQFLQAGLVLNVTVATS